MQEVWVWRLSGGGEIRPKLVSGAKGAVGLEIRQIVEHVHSTNAKILLNLQYGRYRTHSRPT